MNDTYSAYWACRIRSVSIVEVVSNKIGLTVIIKWDVGGMSTCIGEF